MTLPEEHLENLWRHIDLVRQAGILLAKRLIQEGRKDFARVLLANILIHDRSKFSGIEWDYLHVGAGVSPMELELASKQHRFTNHHHPEYWGGFENMPEVAIAEMACDFYARSQEFGTGLRDWINEQAVARYSIDEQSKQFSQLNHFVDLLTLNYFKTP